MSKQLQLFAAGEIEKPKPKRPNKGKGSAIVYYDYESYVAKFTDNPKTTDDTFTPRDVYEAVVQYVSEVYDMTDKVILRPFFPGGDYENAEYPENGVVIDNPPFSLFTKICRFYTAREIPFFLFGPGMTIGSCTKYCTAVITGGSGIEFTNKALVRCNFASNLFGDTLIMTAPRLLELIEACPSQTQKANLPCYEYPEEMLSVSAMQTIGGGGVEFAVKRSEAVVIRGLDEHPKGKEALFGDHWLISKAKAKAMAKAKAKAKAIIKIPLSKREKAIVKRLSENDHDDKQTD